MKIFSYQWQLKCLVILNWSNKICGPLMVQITSIVLPSNHLDTWGDDLLILANRSTYGGRLTHLSPQPQCIAMRPYNHHHHYSIRYHSCRSCNNTVQSKRSVNISVELRAVMQEVPNLSLIFSIYRSASLHVLQQAFRGHDQLAFNFTQGTPTV